MKVTDILKSSEKHFSFELLPPLKGDGPDKVYGAIERLMPYGPAFINVTCHREEAKYEERADGSLVRHIMHRRPGTVGISAAIERRYGVPAVPHIICGGQSRYDLEDALIDLDLLGIRNVLALRGDPMPGSSRFVPHAEGWGHASELVAQIAAMNREEYIDGEPGTSHRTDFCIGVAGYPEKHFEAPNSECDMQALRKKVDAGADFIATQICYSAERLIAFRAECEQAGITVPIVPGLKPLATMGQLTALPRVFAIDLPEELVSRVGECRTNDDVRRVGTLWAIEQGRQLLKAGFPCLHFYTMTRTEQVENIIKEILCH